jgi:hypothetical protein
MTARRVSSVPLVVQAILRWQKQNKPDAKNKDRQDMLTLAVFILSRCFYGVMKVTSAGIPGLSFSSGFGTLNLMA